MATENNAAVALLSNTIEKVKDMIDISTIIGDPVYTESGLTIIPVSKVTYGFVTGGANLPVKNDFATFDGVGGAGVTITPVAFLMIQDGKVTVKHISGSADTAEKVVNLGSDVFDKVSGLLKK